MIKVEQISNNAMIKESLSECNDLVKVKNQQYYRVSLFENNSKDKFITMNPL